MVSEGGGQGLLTLACLQDLSQARGRWGSAADGFLSLFGTTVVLPGIGDVRTLEALSALAGEEEVRTRSVSAPVPRPGGVGAVLSRVVLGPRAQRSGQVPTVTTSTVMRRRLPVDVVARGAERDGARGRRAQPHGMGAAHAVVRHRAVALRGARPGSRGRARPRSPRTVPGPLVPGPGMGRDVGPGGL